MFGEAPKSTGFGEIMHSRVVHANTDAEQDISAPGGIRGWLRRPQWSLRSLFLVTLLVAIICASLSLFDQYQARKLHWIPYSAVRLAQLQKEDVPVLVLYQSSWSFREEHWTESPFEDAELVRSFNQAGCVMMNTRSPWGPATASDFEAIRRELAAVGGKMPIIVIYDSRRGNLVIHSQNETEDERRERVGKLLRDYLEPQPRPKGKAK